MTNEYLNILVKVDKETGELTVIKQQLSDLDKMTQSSIKSTNALSGAFGFLKSVLPIASVAGLIALFKESISLAEAQNESYRKLTSTLVEQGLGTDKTAKQIMNYAESLQRVSRVDSEQFVNALTQTINKIGNLSTSMRIVNAAIGVSKEGTISFDTALFALTMGMQGNQRAMMMLRQQFGAYIDINKSTQENTEGLIKRFETQTKDTESLTATSKQLGSAVQDLKRDFGLLFTKEIAEQAKSLAGFVNDISLGTANLKLIVDKTQLKNLYKQEGRGKAGINQLLHQEVKLRAELMKAVEEGDKEKQKSIKTDLDSNKKSQEIRNKEIEAKQSDIKMIKDFLDYKYGATVDTNNLININEDLTSRQAQQIWKEKNEQLEKISVDYNNKIQALDTSNFEAKRKLVNQQMDEELEKVALLETGKVKISKKEFENWKKNKTNESKAKISIEKYTAEQIDKINKEETIRKTENAQKVFEISRTFLEAGLTLMGEEFKKRKEWAIAMIALDKAIAIMAAIAAGQRMALETRNPGLAWAYAAAQIALITAQAVQQIRALNESSSNIESSSSNDSESTSNPLTTESHEIGGSSTSSINSSSGSGAESGKTTVSVSFNVIDPTNLTADAQEKMARWLKNVLANENNR